MQIGLDDYKPEELEYFQDLGVTWTKLNVVDVDKGVDEQFVTKADSAANNGLRIVADMRPSAELHEAISKARVQADEDGSAFEALIEPLVSGVTANVQRYGELVSAWEFWGEYDCPYVGGFFPGKAVTYPNILKRVHAAVKDVDANAPVWNGGYGVNFQRHFADALIAEAPDAFDALNWHHYNITEYGANCDALGNVANIDTLSKRVFATSEKFRTMFAGVRETMDAAGCRQPFVASEWGMPVVPDEMAAGARFIGLFSFVFQSGTFGLGDTEACAYLDGWLSTFAEAGMEVLIYHRLRDDVPHGTDRNGTFWGVYCGLLDAAGEPKRMYGALKDWARKAAG